MQDPFYASMPPTFIRRLLQCDAFFSETPASGSTDLFNDQHSRYDFHHSIHAANRSARRWAGDVTLRRRRLPGASDRRRSSLVPDDGGRALPAPEPRALGELERLDGLLKKDLLAALPDPSEHCASSSPERRVGAASLTGKTN